MIKIFRSNGIGQFVIFAIVALLLWGRSFIVPPTPVEYGGFSPIYEWLYRLMMGHEHAATVLAFVLVIVEGLWMSNLLYNYKIIAQNSVLPALIYVVMMGFDSAAQTLTPHLIVNGIILFFLDRVMLLGVPNMHNNNIFDASAAVALAAMVHTPSLALIVPLFAVLIMYKQYSWRDWTVMLLGFMAPLIIMAVVLYIREDFGHAIFLLDYDLTSFKMDMGKGTTYQMVSCGLVMLGFLVSLMMYPSTTSDLAADSKKDAAILTMMLIYAATQLFYSHLYPVDTQLIAPTFAFLFNGFLIGGRRRTWIYDLSLITFIVLAII